MPGMATPNIVFLWSRPRRLGCGGEEGFAAGGGADGLGAGAATPTRVCLPPGPCFPTGSPPAARAAAAPAGAPTGTGAAGIPSIVPFSWAFFCGAGGDAFGAIPIIVFFIDAEGGAL